MRLLPEVHSPEAASGKPGMGVGAGHCGRARSPVACPHLLHLSEHRVLPHQAAQLAPAFF